MSVAPLDLNTYESIVRTMCYPKLSNRINLERFAGLIGYGLSVNHESDSSKVSGFVYCLMLAHERVYAARYHEPVNSVVEAIYPTERAFWDASFSHAKLMTDIELLRKLEFVQYQLCEPNIDGGTAECLESMVNALAMNIVRSLPEYGNAAWG